jgi:hypothetical protein
MYIAYNIKNHKVIEISEKPFITVTENVAVAECNEIPTKYDYLLVTNLREATRIVEEAYTEKVVELNEKTQTEETKIIQHPQVIETYIACDLIPKFYEYTAEQLEKQKEKRYHDLTEKYIRKQYSQGKMESVINNYLEYKETYANENALLEYNKMQAYRKECKAKAYKEVYGVAK